MQQAPHIKKERTQKQNARENNNLYNQIHQENYANCT